MQREEDGQVSDHPDHGRRDAGQRGGQVVVVAEAFDVRGAEEDEEEARHERHPGYEDRREDRGDPGVKVAGVAVSADEATNWTTAINGPGVVSASASPRTISPGASDP